jgi:hypothetical protein
MTCFRRAREPGFTSLFLTRTFLTACPDGVLGHVVGKTAAEPVQGV